MYDWLYYEYQYYGLDITIKKSHKKINLDLNDIYDFISL